MLSCDSFDILQNSNFEKVINNSSWIFIISLEGNLAQFEEFVRIENVSNHIHRQLLFNIYNETDEREINFVMMKESFHLIENLTEYDVLQNFTIDGFLSHLMQPQDKLKDKKFENLSNLIMHSINNLCTVCIRFAQLIDKRYVQYWKLYEGQIDEPITCDKNCFQSILNVPFTFEFGKVSNEIFLFFQENYINQLTKAKFEALNIGHKSSVDKFLNKSEARMNLEGLSALAWSQKEHKVFEFLIRAECPYPKNYQNDHDDVTHELSIYEEEMNEFHKNIREGNFDKVEKFCESHNNLTFARNLNNTSAMQVAFESEQFKIFSYLRSRGMMLSNLNEMAEHYSQRYNMSMAKKKKIRHYNIKNVTPVYEINLIDRLMQQSSIVFNPRKLNVENLKTELRRAFEDLNEQINDLLTIVASNDNYEMVFDFDNRVIDDIDPKQINNLGGAFRSYALIAAADLLNNDKYERDFVLGTIAHEVAHIAMNFLYDNEMKPYSMGDNESITNMIQITDDCRKTKYASSLMITAFNGDESNLHPELIARVPDMLVTYRNKISKFNRRSRIYKSLFDYYNKKVAKDIKTVQKTMSARMKVMEINKWFGVVQELRRLDETFLTNYSDEEIAIEAGVKIHVFITNHVNSMLRKIYEKAMREFEVAIFMRLSYTTHQNFKSALYEIDRVKTDVLLVIYCDNFFHKLKDFQERFEMSSLERIIFVGKNDCKIELMKLNLTGMKFKIFN